MSRLRLLVAGLQAQTPRAPSLTQALPPPLVVGSLPFGKRNRRITEPWA